MRYEIADDALGECLTSAARTKGLNLATIAARYVAERFVDHWHHGMGTAPILLVGGLQFRQELRATKDADLRSVVRYGDDELLKGCRRVKEIIRPEGVDLIDVRLGEIFVGPSEPVKQLQVSALVGRMPASAVINVASGFWGRDAWSSAWTANVKHAPLFCGGPTYTASVQGIAPNLAERWIMIATKAPDDWSMKVHADLLFFHARGVNMKDVASEILRVLRYRRISVQEFTVGVQRALTSTAILRRTAEWEQVRAENRSMSACGIDQALVSLNKIYRHGVFPALSKAHQQFDLEPPHAATAKGNLSEVNFTANSVAAPSPSSNVVAFRR